MSENLKKIDTLIFDYDGTLHNSIHLYGPAFRKAFSYLVEIVPDMVKESGYDLNKEWTDHEISHWLGYTKEEMWATFMPLLPDTMKARAGKMIGDEMNKLLSQHKAYLYTGALETLADLKKLGYKLVFLSNCSLPYMEAHTRNFKLDDYFDHMVCAGQYPKKSKKEILGHLIDEGLLKANTSVMIGDRAQDIETGLGNGLMTVGCLYGFGRHNELDEATVHIETVTDLKAIFKGQDLL